MSAAEQYEAVQKEATEARSLADAAVKKAEDLEAAAEKLKAEVEGTAEESSSFQQKIEGEWFGKPAVFDTTGTHLGFCKVNRSSVHKDGQTTYYMNTNFKVFGDRQARLEASDFAFGVVDRSDFEGCRIYLGPDFIGAGYPYGMLVDAHYYSPGWTSDLRTLVHILPDGKTQAYSSLLYDGPTIHSVFNGVYKVAFDYKENAETKTWVDEFVESEEAHGPNTHLLPTKVAGKWVGQLVAYNAKQEKAGTIDVVIDHKPLNLVRAQNTVTMKGVINREYTFTRHRNGNLHAFEGDIFGNAISYGRALYTSQHFAGEAYKIKGREFFYDQEHNLSVVWQVFKGDIQEYMVYGVLAWEEGDAAIDIVRQIERVKLEGEE